MYLKCEYIVPGSHYQLGTGKVKPSPQRRLQKLIAYKDDVFVKLKVGSEKEGESFMEMQGAFINYWNLA